MALKNSNVLESHWERPRGDFQPSGKKGFTWFSLFLILLCSSLNVHAQALESSPKLESSRKIVKWGRLELSLPRQISPGQAFSLRFSGRGASRVRVRFPLEGFETLGSTFESPESVKKSFVLGRARLEDQKNIPLELISQYEILKLSLPLEVEKKEVQQLEFEKTEFLSINKNRSAEDFKLGKIYGLSGSRAWTEPFAAPARGRITSPYGTPRQYTPGTPISYHSGIDYGSPSGTPIYAVNAGQVAFVGNYAVRGNITVLNHGLGLYTAYLHQSKILVKVGQKVARGQKIGEIGSTGLSTAPHLHLEFRLRGVAVSPLEWLGRVMP